MEKETRIYARQGDLVIEKLATPIVGGELVTATNHVFAGDSSGHPHTLRGTALIRRSGAITHLRIAEKMELTHGKAGGHRTVALEPGDYEVRPLRERGGAGTMAAQGIAAAAGRRAADLRRAGARDAAHRSGRAEVAGVAELGRREVRARAGPDVRGRGVTMIVAGAQGVARSVAAQMRAAREAAALKEKCKRRRPRKSATPEPQP